MAASATVTYSLKDAGFADYANRDLEFRLLQAGAESGQGDVVAGSRIVSTSDANGDGSVTLYVNGDSEIQSVYQIKFPNGERSKFIIPAGVTNIELADLLALYNPDNTPQDQTPSDTFLVKSLNLSDLPDTGAARTALDVYSISDVNGFFNDPSSNISLNEPNWKNALGYFIAQDSASFDTLTLSMGASPSVFSLDFSTDTGFKGIGAGVNDFGYYRDNSLIWQATASGMNVVADLGLSGDLSFGGQSVSSIETSLSGSPTALPNSEAVQNYVSSVQFESIVIVKEASDLSGTLLSDKTYYIDGEIDMGTQSITVPAGGLVLTGTSFDVSKLFSTEDNYSMFVSPVGGSGNVFFRDFAIDVSGANSKVYDLVANNGFEAIEVDRVNYNNCTSLGEIDNYRQGLETGTGRFGGTPNLTLTGTWLGGFFIDTSIVRSLDASMTGALFQAGVGFVMNSRFRSNQNIDLPASAAFIDFAPSNFPNPSTVQLQGCLVTRNGVFNSTDSNLTPNITKADVESAWSANQGLQNTFVGGSLTVDAESATNISTIGQFEILEASTWLAERLEHFEDIAVPTSGRALRHLGNDPREYSVVADFAIEGPPNDEVTLRLVKFKDSDSTTEIVYTQTRVVNNFQGGRDTAFFSLPAIVELDKNDYVYLEVTNQSDVGNLTAESESIFSLVAR